MASKRQFELVPEQSQKFLSIYHDGLRENFKILYTTDARPMRFVLHILMDRYDFNLYVLMETSLKKSKRLWCKGDEDGVLMDVDTWKKFVNLFSIDNEFHGNDVLEINKVWNDNPFLLNKKILCMKIENCIEIKEILYGNLSVGGSHVTRDNIFVCFEEENDQKLFRNILDTVNEFLFKYTVTEKFFSILSTITCYGNKHKTFDETLLNFLNCIRDEVKRVICMKIEVTKNCHEIDYPKLYQYLSSTDMLEFNVENVKKSLLASSCCCYFDDEFFRVIRDGVYDDFFNDVFKKEYDYPVTC